MMVNSERTLKIFSGNQQRELTFSLHQPIEFHIENYLPGKKKRFILACL